MLYQEIDHMIRNGYKQTLADFVYELYKFLQLAACSHNNISLCADYTQGKGIVCTTPLNIKCCMSQHFISIAF